MFPNLFRRRKRCLNQEVFPDEIFLDSKNLPQFDTHQFEGRIEKSIGTRTIYGTAIFFVLVFMIFIWKSWGLQVANGDVNAKRAENNRLDHKVVFADRGIIYDRNGSLLAWNSPDDTEDFSKRTYTATSGFAHLLGYVSYPKKDKKGFYYDEELVGKEGVEGYYDSLLQGKNGLKITETDALNKVVSESILRPPEHGNAIKLSIDARVQAKLYEEMKGLAERVGFKGASAAIMNVKTGELLAYTSYPEYNPQVMTDGDDTALIKNYLSDKRNVFLNRLSQGLYTPGSIMKPYVALGALQEKTVSPNKVIVSTGKLEVPNKYDPKNPSVFTDWKAHGPVDMRRAIAVSSNIYFYEVGGGFGDITGLGITRLEKYFRLFGFGTPLTGFFEGKAGIVPNPEWKKENFNGDDWRLGDTYFTSIGQYGFQLTPMQALRGVSAIANKGRLIEPTIFAQDPGYVAEGIDLPIDKENFQVIHEGMRQGAVEGTGKALGVPYVEVAVKTGTAELGVSKAKVNSSNEGFWPYKDPKYAFVVMMEQGYRTNTIGSVYIMRQLLDWMNIYTPEYLK